MKSQFTVLYVPAVSTLRTYKKANDKAKPEYHKPYRVSIDDYVFKGNLFRLENLLQLLPEKYNHISLVPIVLYPHISEGSNRSLIVRFRMDSNSPQNQRNAKNSSTCGPLAREILGKNRDQFKAWNSLQNVYHSTIRYIQGMFFIVPFSGWKNKTSDENIVKITPLTPEVVAPLRISEAIGHPLQQYVKAVFCQTNGNPIEIKVPCDHYSNYGSKPGQGILPGHMPRGYEDLGLVRSKVMFDFDKASGNSENIGFCVVRFEEERDYQADISEWLSKELETKNAFFKKWNQLYDYFSPESIPYVKGPFILIQYNCTTERSVDFGELDYERTRKVSSNKNSPSWATSTQSQSIFFQDSFTNSSSDVRDSQEVKGEYELTPSCPTGAAHKTPKKIGPLEMNSSPHSSYSSSSELLSSPASPRSLYSDDDFFIPQGSQIQNTFESLKCSQIQQTFEFLNDSYTSNAPYEEFRPNQREEMRPYDPMKLDTQRLQNMLLLMYKTRPIGY